MIRVVDDTERARARLADDLAFRFSKSVSRGRGVRLVNVADCYVQFVAVPVRDEPDDAEPDAAEPPAAELDAGQLDEVASELVLPYPDLDYARRYEPPTYALRVEIQTIVSAPRLGHGHHKCL